MEPAKWESILEEAAKAFGRFGFKKTSIDDIARAAGVAKGTVYLGCTSKMDLFYQAILRDLRLWNGELARLIDPRTPADEMLVAVAQTAFLTLDRYPLARDLITNVYAADLPDTPDPGQDGAWPPGGVSARGGWPSGSVVTAARRCCGRCASRSRRSRATSSPP